MANLTLKDAINGIRRGDKLVFATPIDGEVKEGYTVYVCTPKLRKVRGVTTVAEIKHG